MLKLAISTLLTGPSIWAHSTLPVAISDPARPSLWEQDLALARLLPSRLGLSLRAQTLLSMAISLPMVAPSFWAHVLLPMVRSRPAPPSLWAQALPVATSVPAGRSLRSRTQSSMEPPSMNPPLMIALKTLRTVRNVRELSGFQVPSYCTGRP
jgi:hypothetical protein